MTDDQVGESTAPENVDTAPGGQPQYGVGPFSVREVALVGVWLVAFVVSFFSIASQQAMAQLLFGGSVWTNGLDWVLTIALPTVAVFLIVLRRFSPDGIRRVGSLGIDQFASVAFSVSAVVWLTLLWRNVAVAVESSVWIYGWVVWVEFFLMLAGVVLTVFAPLIPPLSEDFAGRREVVAHRNARPIRPVVARPPRERQAPAADSAGLAGAAGAGAQTEYGDTRVPGSPYTDSSYPDSYTEPLDTEDGDGSQSVAEQIFADADGWAPAQARDTFEPVEEVSEVTEYEPHPSHQAFWALAPDERDVLDERGVPIFRVGPTAWALVLEDRGEVFVVRHEDGRVGYLHDVSGVMRG
ncbi:MULTISPECIES: hypothetical protein [unclassified Microbacterium]|uniref:hypothetical protein n=1 Tax=unclassified Microbacterium TaxID=2609290 RepID=UPI00214AA7B3|nr:MULTISPECIES: hypothetical protein [unclassified Microbacterium]MCR2809167.1 hypothetical protein [Microbacterium sp. zg.B185]WIM20318.1 hypothetical protein QNO12_05810 [Microbacterium sp. zg-B185]